MLQVGKHGDKHRDCGQKCVKDGQPVGLLTEDSSCMLIDEGTIPPRQPYRIRKQAVDLMARVVTIHGTFTEVGSQSGLCAGLGGEVSRPTAGPTTTIDGEQGAGTDSRRIGTPWRVALAASRCAPILSQSRGLHP